MLHVASGANLSAKTPAALPAGPRRRLSCPISGTQRATARTCVLPELAARCGPGMGAESRWERSCESRWERSCSSALAASSAASAASAASRAACSTAASARAAADSIAARAAATLREREARGARQNAAEGAPPPSRAPSRAPRCAPQQRQRRQQQPAGAPLRRCRRPAWLERGEGGNRSKKNACMMRQRLSACPLYSCKRDALCARGRGREGGPPCGPRCLNTPHGRPRPPTACAAPSIWLRRDLNLPAGNRFFLSVGLGSAAEEDRGARREDARGAERCSSIGRAAGALAHEGVTPLEGTTYV